MLYRLQRKVLDISEQSDVIDDNMQQTGREALCSAEVLTSVTISLWVLPIIYINKLICFPLWKVFNKHKPL